jgi:hypothetical protein
MKRQTDLKEALLTVVKNHANLQDGANEALMERVYQCLDYMGCVMRSIDQGDEEEYYGTELYEALKEGGWCMVESLRPTEAVMCRYCRCTYEISEGAAAQYDIVHQYVCADCLSIGRKNG